MLTVVRRNVEALPRPIKLSAWTGLILPGFLDSRHNPAIDSLVKALTDAGVSAQSPEQRRADLGPTAHLADMTRVLDQHLAERVVLAGHCYGALLACLAAARDPRVTDVVAIMPTRCFIWPEDYDPAKDTWRRDGVRSFTGERQDFGVPYSVVEDAVSYDLPGALKTLQQRILFIAGDQDELIGVEPVRRLHAECGSPDKTLAVLPVQHDYRDLPEQIEIVNRCVVDWLRR